MARPTKITDEQILSAARDAFLNKGFAAPTADIARAAQVSEGTLFKRFATKEALFFAALGLPQQTPWGHRLATCLGAGDLRKNLFTLGTELIEFFRDLIPRLTMMWSCPVAPADRARLHASISSVPQQAIVELTDYFAGEMRLGRLRRGNPDVVVRMFAGALYHFVSMEMHLGMVPTTKAASRGGRAKSMTSDVYLHGLIDTLWQGLDPRRPKP